MIDSSAPLTPRAPLGFEPTSDSAWMVAQRLRALELAVGLGGSDDQVIDRAARFADFMLEARAARWTRGLIGRFRQAVRPTRPRSGERG